MCYDNQRAIALAYDLVYNVKTNHVELDNIIIDNVVPKRIKVCFVPNEDQTTDVLTKALIFK